MPKLGLYVHIPFCETKCGYCDFYSIPLKNRRTDGLVDALIDELGRRCAGSGCEILTVFVGGGTPTVLPFEPFRRFFTTLGSVLACPVREFTVEANPATVDDAKLEILKSVGVDRLSFGAQSWHASELETLERLHAAADIPKGVALARAHGIDRINLDLIFGIPGQTMASWKESIQKTIDQGVDHICCYGLTYEEGTRLTAMRDVGTLRPCDEELEAEMYLAAIDTLKSAGFAQYEISNFARPRQQCLHNLIYWRNEPYIGIGPSAAGYVNGERYRNVADVNRYVQLMSANGYAVAESERANSAELAGEIVMMGLRLVEGFSVQRFKDRTGIDPREAMPQSLARHEVGGLVTVTPQHIALTRAGMSLADCVISDCFTELHQCTAFDHGELIQS